MPATKNATTRYKILDDLLQNKYHNYSLDDLTEEVNARLAEIDPHDKGVTRRCIEKDISYLEYKGPFLAEIERYTITDESPRTGKTRKKYCLRYADPSFSIFKKEMTDDEKYLLKEVLYMLGQFDSLPNMNALDGLRKGLGIKGEERNIISFTKNPIGESSILGQLFTAISNKQVIDITYRKFQEEASVYRVHPYLLKEYNRRWFLVCASIEDGKILTLALDRTVTITPFTSVKYKEYDGDINDRFEDIIGITYYDDEPTRLIEFWASDSAKNYIDTKPLHDSQIHFVGEKESDARERYPSLAEGAFYSIECKKNYELIRELTSFGKDLIVLSPSAIRQEIAQRISEMNSVYKNIE